MQFSTLAAPFYIPTGIPVSSEKKKNQVFSISNHFLKGATGLHLPPKMHYLLGPLILWLLFTPYFLQNFIFFFSLHLVLSWPYLRQ